MPVIHKVDAPLDSFIPVRIPGIITFVGWHSV